jgi:prepilin-type N-terminal cleavage/methylation domain-containing protein
MKCRLRFGWRSVVAAQRGFTLIEVIVAMVILSTSGVVLFSWISQNLATASRLRETQARSQLQLEGVSWLETINPALELEGERELAGMKLVWRAVLVEPMRTEFDYGGGLHPRWMLGLYDVHATITRAETGLRMEWSQSLVGWQPVTAAVSGASSPPSSGGRAP